MNLNSYAGLLFPAAGGLFFFLKKPYSEEMYVKESEKSPISVNKDGRTGVARYIENQLPSSDEKALEETSRPMLSGVAKYILDREQHQLSKVARYALRLEIAERQANRTKHFVETGVARYLKNQVILPKITGVTKYLKKQEKAPKISSVSKYLTRIKYAENASSVKASTLKETSVSRYMKQQEELPKFTTVSKYLVRKELLEKNTDDKRLVIKVTGVSRYLLKQQSLPRKSSVDKYIKIHTAVTEQIPVILETKVDKYIRSRF